MKEVSAKTFFTVLWSGICQAFGWFFGLFGYKRDGKFAKCVWGLFSISTALFMTIVVCVLIYGLSDEVVRWYNRNFGSCDVAHCYWNEWISREVNFHNHEDGRGFIYNSRTGEKFIENVRWIAKPLGNDTLVCFSNGKKRGYFNKYTGKLVIEPKYDRAWVFSDGLAAVEENGYIKFIDGTGKTVIDSKLRYNPRGDGYAFHGGYCRIEDDQDKYGIIDKKGNLVLPMEYSYIFPSNTFDYWCVRKGDMMGVYDSNMETVLPMTECRLILCDDNTILVTMADHTMRKYNMQGELINDFYIYNVNKLEYETDEIVYQEKQNSEESYDENVQYYHPKETARLRSYEAGDCYKGLITTEGRMVTMPLYKEIQAIGPDLYLCTTSDYYENVIINGKGEIVK